MCTLSLFSACTLAGTLQVILGFLDPCNYRILHDEEGVGNGAYDYHAEQSRGVMYLKILPENHQQFCNFFQFLVWEMNS